MISNHHLHKKFGLADAIIRAMLLAILWWSLAADAKWSWGFGAVIIFAATYLSLALTSRVYWHVNIRATIRFLLYFFIESLAGGIDIARRVFNPMLPLHQGFIEYQVHLNTMASRVFFMNVISLLPGTLSVKLKDNILTVHVLDMNTPVIQSIQALELRISDLFSIPLSTDQEKNI